jgi:hypothetical protein
MAEAKWKYVGGRLYRNLRAWKQKTSAVAKRVARRRRRVHRR